MNKMNAILSQDFIYYDNNELFGLITGKVTLLMIVFFLVDKVHVTDAFYVSIQKGIRIHHQTNV